MTLQRFVTVLLLNASYSCLVKAYEGYGTVYSLSSPFDGNCNFMSWPKDAVTKYAALNAEQWDETMNCGRCAKVSCTDASCTGQSEIVYIMDQCPGCAYGDLDLSSDVFEGITGQSYTKLSIEWMFVDCPITNNVQFCLKTGSSESWVAVQPANFVSGVASLSINDQKTTMVDSAYYFLIDGGGKKVVDLTSVKISVRGVNGEVLKETLSLTADKCTDGNGQFVSKGDTFQTTITKTASSGPTPPPTAPPAPELPAPTPPPTATPAPELPAPTPPASTPPATTLPASTPPAPTLPASTPPAPTPPAPTPPATAPPSPTPIAPESPVATPPASTPTAPEPPVATPPAPKPPVATPPAPEPTAPTSPTPEPTATAPPTPEPTATASPAPEPTATAPPAPTPPEPEPPVATPPEPKPAVATPPEPEPPVAAPPAPPAPEPPAPTPYAPVTGTTLTMKKRLVTTKAAAESYGADTPIRKSIASKSVRSPLSTPNLAVQATLSSSNGPNSISSFANPKPTVGTKLSKAAMISPTNSFLKSNKTSQTSSVLTNGFYRSPSSTWSATNVKSKTSTPTHASSLTATATSVQTEMSSSNNHVSVAVIVAAVCVALGVVSGVSILVHKKRKLIKESKSTDRRASLEEYVSFRSPRSEVPITYTA